MKIGIVSAEPSGDLLGRKILDALEQKFPELRVHGIGDGGLNKYGVSNDRSLLKIMGFVEPIMNYSDIKKFQNCIIDDLIDKKIDLFIGIDSPDFNFGIHKRLQEEGITTVQVVCPSVWAWRSGRMKNFKFIDYMLCLFPFELKYCSNVRKESFYIGHPLAEEQDKYIGNKKDTSPHAKDNIICLMPGSRDSEIKQNLPVMIEGYKKFSKQHDGNYIALIPVYDSSAKELVETYIEDESNISCHQTKSSEILKIAKAAVICSGTATLEGLLAEVPTTIVYKTSLLNYLIFRSMMKSEFAGIPNILAEREIFTELIQNQATKDSIANDLQNNLINLDAKISEMKEVKRKIIRTDFSAFSERLYEDYRRKAQ